MEDRLEYAEQVKDLAEKLNLPKDIIEPLSSLYLLTDDPSEMVEIRGDIEALLGNHLPTLVSSSKPVLAPPEESDGEITLGNVIHPYLQDRDFSINLSDMPRHLLIASSTGAGKTTLIIRILLQLLNLPNPIPFLVLDFKKDFRHIPPEYGIKVLRWEWLKVNPLQPPEGVGPIQWLTTLADVCAHVFGWFHASENYLLEFAHELFEKYKSDGYSSLWDLYERMVDVNERSKKRSEYFDVVMNRLKSMLIVFGDQLAYREGFPIEELLKYPLVLELDGLKRDEANFVVEWLLTYVFAYRMASGHRGDLRHVIVFDEATRFFHGKREYRQTTIELGMPFIDTVPQIIRDYGEGLIFAVQEPSMLSHSVLANTNLKIVGFLGEGVDIEAMAKSLDLDDEERSAISKLERGEWLVKKGGMPPFLLRSHDFPINKIVTNEELRERMEPLLAELSQKVRPYVPSQIGTLQPSTIDRMPSLSEDAKKILFDVCKHPFIGVPPRGVSIRYRKLGLAGRAGTNAKKELVEKNLVEEIGIPLGSHRPTKFLVPTRLGLKFLQNSQKDISQWRFLGQVSFQHRLLQGLIAYYHRKAGHTVSLEKELIEGRIDVLVVADNKKIGIEVELNPNTDVWKYLKTQRELDQLIIVCNELPVLNSIEQAVNSTAYPHVRERIKIYLATSYLSQLRDIISNSRGNNLNNSIEPYSDELKWKKRGKKEKK